MRALLLPTLLAAASCYNPSILSGRYKCDQPGDVCPADFVCAAGRCVDPKDVPADLASGAVDARGDDGSSPPDLSMVTDLRSTPTPDLLNADLTIPSTCTQVGVSGARDVLACKAVFASGNIAGICSAGYRTCNADDAALLDQAAAGMACKNLGGFYAAQIAAALKANSDVACESPTQMSGWALVGCGSEVLAANAGMDGTRTVGNDCKKLKVILPCDGTVKGWTCTTGLGDTTQANVGRGGLLCCKLP